MGPNLHLRTLAVLTKNIPVEVPRQQGMDTLQFNPLSLQMERLQPRETVSHQRAPASHPLALGPLLVAWLTTHSGSKSVSCLCWKRSPPWAVDESQLCLSRPQGIYSPEERGGGGSPKELLIGLFRVNVDEVTGGFTSLT